MVWDVGLWDITTWDDEPKSGGSPSVVPKQKNLQIQIGLTEDGKIIWILPLRKNET